MRTHIQNPVPSAHIVAMSTPLVAPLKYPWLTQAYDSVWFGRRDAGPKLAHESRDGRQPSVSLRRLDAALQERCENTRRSAVKTAAPILDRLQRLQRSRDALLRTRTELAARIADLSEHGSEAPAEVSKTEEHLTSAQRANRRAREHAMRMAPLKEQYERMSLEVTAGDFEIADLEGRLTTLWEWVQATVEVLAFYYERRCSTQVRGYLRRTPAGADHPLNTRAPVAPPEWARQPNPWLATSTDASTHAEEVH